MSAISHKRPDDSNLVLALRIGTGRAFHKVGPDIEKALDRVLCVMQGKTNLFEFVESTYFAHFGRTSTSYTNENMYIYILTHNKVCINIYNVIQQKLQICTLFTHMIVTIPTNNIGLRYF